MDNPRGIRFTFKEGCRVMLQQNPADPFAWMGNYCRVMSQVIEKEASFEDNFEALRLEEAFCQCSHNLLDSVVRAAARAKLRDPPLYNV